MKNCDIKKTTNKKIKIQIFQMAKQCYFKWAKLFLSRWLLSECHLTRLVFVLVCLHTGQYLSISVFLCHNHFSFALLSDYCLGAEYHIIILIKSAVLSHWSVYIYFDHVLERGYICCAGWTWIQLLVEGQRPTLSSVTNRHAHTRTHTHVCSDLQQET